jgi:oxygen-independent coproporphyrinogen-3 oxidase
MPCKQKHTDLAPPPCRALYVHVPFCIRKCSYCDFCSVPIEETRAAAYLNAVKRELAGKSSMLALPVGSVFVGGGTPTALETPLLQDLLSAIHPLCGPETEFTVEANPATIDRDKAQLLSAMGANRVSMGAQSFVGRELDVLGRAHKPEDVAMTAAILRDAGIANLSLDLMFGLPGQTVTSWQQSLERCADLLPSHVSCYALSVERGTELARKVRAGRLQEMEDDLQADCYDLAVDFLSSHGLSPYELSNFARPGHRCRHNLTYWRNLPYVGIGPAASSYDGRTRSTNVCDIDAYINSMQAGESAVSRSERIEGRRKLAEGLMLGLRLVEGVFRKDFVEQYGTDPADSFAQVFSRHRANGLLEITPENVRLTRRAWFVANTVFADLFEDM